MKKVFSLSDTHPLMWDKMAENAFRYAEHIKFNILYTDENLASSFISTFGARYAIENPIRKFYSSGKILSIELSACEEVLRVHLKDFNYWKNKPIEDPSFWKGNEELLACITHENMVMIDDTYFADIVDDLNLFDLSDE